MLSPPSFRLAFKPHRATAAELKKIAGTRIQTDVCAPNGWLFDDRVKSEESALAKLQFGPVRSLQEMNDLYAATVVVPTPKEIPLAVRAIKDSLPDATRSRRRIGKANTFEYDDVHVIAALGKEAAALSPGLRDRKFEVQIHTGLQFAWWRATHDVIYKGSQRSWQLIRMASQIRASLELLDATLSNLRGAANLLPAVTDKEDAQFRESMRWLEKWSDEEKPEDRLRFASSTIELANASGLSLAKIEALLDQGLISDSGTTPFQAVLGSVVAAHGAGVLEGLKARRYVLVTEEFEAACPTICEVPASRRATLDARP